MRVLADLVKDTDPTWFNVRDNSLEENTVGGAAARRVGDLLNIKWRDSPQTL
jgi:hypothetical protein